jgi:hypothetical protein
LLAEEAAERLAPLLRPDDALVVISVRAPCRTPATMPGNLAWIVWVHDASFRHVPDVGAQVPELPMNIVRPSDAYCPGQLLNRDTEGGERFRPVLPGLLRQCYGSSQGVGARLFREPTARLVNP